MKIKVKPEGREGIYLITNEEAIKLVKSIKSKHVHHQYQGGTMMIGADWDKKEVLEHLKKVKKIAIVIEPNLTIGHHLVTVTKTKRNAFDVGEITKKELEISK